MPKKTTTIAITNFAGRLTRYINGELNSGFAKFSNSWGYDPFSKPGNLTWNSSPATFSGTISDAILAGTYGNFSGQYIYAVGNSGRIYQIDPVNTVGGGTSPLADTSSVVGSASTVSGGFIYGADIDIYNDDLYVSSDLNIVRFNSPSDPPASVTGSASSVLSNVYHPFVQFQGSLYYGNGNNIGVINSSNIITDGSVLSPALPMGMTIRDLDVTPDGTYMIITASYLPSDQLTSGQYQNWSAQSYLFFWNGSDAGATAFEALPSFPANALSTFLGKRYAFVQDAFGASLYEGITKLLTLPKNITPLPNAATANGNFLTWISPEGIGDPSQVSTAYTSAVGSLYYFGKLDQENPEGLWRMARISATAASSNVLRTPLNMMVNNATFFLTNVIGWGKHYLSVWESTSGGSYAYRLYRFILQPQGGTPVLGVFETQNQLFSKKVGLAQIRVYTEPTVANNGFQLDVIGGDGNPVTNGTFNYSFAAGSDITQLQGSLERINFNPNLGTLYSFGIRITNTGTTNMTIKKIEIDFSEEGK